MGVSAARMWSELVGCDPVSCSRCFPRTLAVCLLRHMSLEVVSLQGPCPSLLNLPLAAGLLWGCSLHRTLVPGPSRPSLSPFPVPCRARTGPVG